MPAKNKMQHNVWLVLAALLLAIGVVSASGITLISASTLSDDTSPIDPVRQNMHNIAYLYANHRWIAPQTDLMPWTSDSIPNYTDRFMDDDPKATLYVSVANNLIHYFFGGTLTQGFMNTNKEITPPGIKTSNGPNSMPLFSIASNLTTEIATDLDNHKIDQDFLMRS